MTPHKNLDVRRVKDSLVATFARANPPLIWRFDLERNHSFTLALQGEDQEWELGVTSPKGEFQPVARFPLREDAEEALLAVSAVLANGSGDRWIGVLRTLGLLLLATFLLLIVMSAIRRWSAPPMVDEEELQGSMAPMPVVPSQPSAPPPANGIPLPAGEALKPPPP